MFPAGKTDEITKTMSPDLFAIPFAASARQALSEITDSVGLSTGGALESNRLPAKEVVAWAPRMYSSATPRKGDPSRPTSRDSTTVRPSAAKAFGSPHHSAKVRVEAATLPP